jgi:hypothetical protein
MAAWIYTIVAALWDTLFCQWLSSLCYQSLSRAGKLPHQCFWTFQVSVAVNRKQVAILGIPDFEETKQCKF